MEAQPLVSKLLNYGNMNLPGRPDLPPGTLLGDLEGKDTLPEDWHERREAIMAQQAYDQAMDEIYWRNLDKIMEQ